MCLFDAITGGTGGDTAMTEANFADFDASPSTYEDPCQGITYAPTVASTTLAPTVASTTLAPTVASTTLAPTVPGATFGDLDTNDDLSVTAAEWITCE